LERQELENNKLLKQTQADTQYHHHAMMSRAQQQEALERALSERQRNQKAAVEHERRVQLQRNEMAQRAHEQQLAMSRGSQTDRSRMLQERARLEQELAELERLQQEAHYQTELQSLRDNKDATLLLREHMLVVGDGDLSFSKELALFLMQENLAHCHTVVATTYDSEQIMASRYPNLAEIVASIEQASPHRNIVRHDIDATRLHEVFLNGCFELIFWNFPHAGAVRGMQDKDYLVNWRHTNMMAKFFWTATRVLRPGGMIQVSSSSTAGGVQESKMLAAAESAGYKLVNRFWFHDWRLAGYNRVYGDYRDSDKRKRQVLVTSTGAQDDKTAPYRNQMPHQDTCYIFELIRKPTGPPKLEKPPGKQQVLNAVDCCRCGLVCPKNRRGYFGEAHLKPKGVHEILQGAEREQAVMKLFAEERFVNLASPGDLKWATG